MRGKECIIISRVDDQDTVIGTVLREDVFRLGANFRVVHIFVFNRVGELLIQKIGSSNARSPGLSGSSVASYVLPSETYEQAAGRALHQELGVDLPLTYLGKTEMLDETCKKFISLFTSISDGPFQADRTKIEGLDFIDPSGIDDMASQGVFTPTFLHVFGYYRSVDCISR
ncbi:MAG TPA: NUDIX domain-containing protein [Candidatus Baltobacteraceae bacterium]|jgi:hypothetical protein|nr:NUDIX domain-containing protein [Candidatus Baltobacteraceae bacterium]